MRRASVTVLIASILAALAGGRHPLGAQGTLLRADGPPAWGTTVRLVSQVTIGTLDGPPEYAFGSVDLVVGEKTGGFFVFDSKYVQIRRYDAAGKLIANIGGKGNGPGEYQELLGMALLEDSALVTWDPRNARVTFFGIDGKVRSSFRALPGDMTYAADVFGIDNAGIVSLQSGIGGTRRYVRYRPNGTVLDTLTSVIDNVGGFLLQTTDGSRYSFQALHFAKPNPLGGLITASTNTLGFATTIGNKPVRVERTYSPVRLGAEERKEWQAYADYFYARAKAEHPQSGVRLPTPALAAIPAVKPAIRDLSVDRDGRTWLDVYTVAEKRNIPPRSKGDARPQLTWREKSAFDVFSRTGEYLGRVTLPAEHQLLDARGDRVWTLTKGPDDEERIVVFRIARK